MRMVFVNSAWPQSWGGGEKWTVEAAQWFGARGHDALVVGRPGSRLLEVANARGLKAVATSFGGDFSPAAIWRARAILSAHRANLAVVNFNKEAWQFGLAAQMLDIPVVARHGFPLLHKGAHHRFLMTRLLDALVVNADSIREHYRALGLPVQNVEVIHNGTALVAQKRGELRKRLGIGADELLVLGAGRLEPQKRFDCFLEIAAALMQRVPKLRFVIAGDGPMQSEFQARIHALQLEDSVTVAGFVPNFAEVAGDADLFLLTSDDEGTPNVLLEAMAAGVACVSFGVGAVPEIFSGTLKDNLIAPGDVAGMTERAALLLDDRELRAQVGAAMRTHIENDFSVDVSMSRFENIFQRTIGGKP